MHSFFRYCRGRDGVAGSAVARELRVKWHRERRPIELGVLVRPAHRVLRSTTFPETQKQRCRLATMGPGNDVISHGAVIRLHDLEGCDYDDRFHLLCRKGLWTGPSFVIEALDRTQREVTVSGVNRSKHLVSS